jgi:replicative DNA helicase
MNKGILICSLEMPAPQVIDRLVARLGRVCMRSLEEGVKSSHDINGVMMATQAISKANVIIRDDLHNIASISATARAMAKSAIGLGVLFVDYIQLVRCDLGKDFSREREVAEVSRTLRLLAMELKCLVIGITQLNEQGKARESRAIGQDATCVMVVKHDEDDPAVRTVTIPIQRSGPCGVKTELKFNGRTATFSQ